MASFLAETFVDAAGHRLPYRLLLPSRAASGDREPVPLVLLLHGAGERGVDNQAQLGNGAGALLGSDGAAARFPCVFVLPQCPPDQRWVEVNWAKDRHTLPAVPSVPLASALGLVEQLVARHGVDRRRLYLVGLSMGGFGVWDVLSRSGAGAGKPGRFAAAVPICGGADEDALGRAAAVPVWAFHGALDPVVKVERSRGAVAALRKAGSAPRYTEYPDVAHDAWTRAFAEPELLPWLFAQRRGD